MWKGLLLCVCVVTAYVMAAPAGKHHRSKRAIPAALAAFGKDALKDIGGKVVGKLGDRIADAVVEDHQKKVVSSLENYFSGKFDKADEEFNQVMARGGDLLSGLGGDFEQANIQFLAGRGSKTDDTWSPAGYEIRVGVDRKDDSKENYADSNGGIMPMGYPMGIGPIMMNGCFARGYQEGDHCYKAFVPIEACVTLLEGSTYPGTGFDGRGEYSADAGKKSLIHRSCEAYRGLQGYHGFDVPDQMTVIGIYESKSKTNSFTGEEELRNHLETLSTAKSAKGMFEQEIDKVRGHRSAGGAFGLVASAGSGSSAQSASDSQTSNFEASSSAGAQLTETSTRTFIAQMELNVESYEIFLDFVVPEDLNMGFLRDFLNLPESYMAIGAEKRFHEFIGRWGTHYITAVTIGGQLKITKAKDASVEDNQEKFAQAAQADFKKVFDTYKAQQSQVKSSSWWHDFEDISEASESRGEAESEVSSTSTSGGDSSLSQYEYSKEYMETKGGDPVFAAAITEFYTTAFGEELKQWLRSIQEYPSAIGFKLQLITDLLDMNLIHSVTGATLFPQGVVDLGCFGSKDLSEDENGHKYYVDQIKDGNKTISQIRYCNFEKENDLIEALDKRRQALQHAVTVYLEEGIFVTSESLIPPGELGCETAELVLLDESNAGAPFWQEMISGDEFKIVFILPYSIPRFLKARDVLHVKYRSKSKRWLTIRAGVTPHMFDGHQNGNSGDISRQKVSVMGLVMTYNEATGTFTVTQEDYDASVPIVGQLPTWIIGMEIAMAEYKSLLEELANRPTGSTRGQMPCNLQWSNAHRIDPTDGGKCIHFTAASEGDIFVVFAAVPNNRNTWITIEISTSGVGLYQAMRLVTTQLAEGAQSPGSDTLYQSYFVCITEDLAETRTTLQFGKTPDSEDRGHIWLVHEIEDIIGLHYYALGSGDQPVKLMGVRLMEKPTGLNLVCRQGTTKEDGRCVQVCHDECDGCRTTGSDNPRDCIGCKNVKVPFRYITGSADGFECSAACPAGMKVAPGTNSCQCLKRMEEEAADDTVECVADCPLTHYDDNNVCKRCGSICVDVSGEGTPVCSGPALDDCTACAYRAADGSCMAGCQPGQKLVPSESDCQRVRISGSQTVQASRMTTYTLTDEVSNNRPVYRSDTRDEYFFHVNRVGWMVGPTAEAAQGFVYVGDGAPLPHLVEKDWQLWMGHWKKFPGVTVTCDHYEGRILTCKACRPGYKCVNGDKTEEICPPGTHSSADGTACDPCPPGKFGAAEGASVCHPCPAGQFNMESSSSSCQSCPAGTYSSAGSTICDSCPVGQYSAIDGSTTCTPCPAGQYSRTSGSTSCRICPPGSDIAEGASDCLACRSPLGMESGAIPDGSITGHPESAAGYEPYRARLNGVTGAGAWAPDEDAGGAWLAVDLGEARSITGIRLQACAHADQWVKSYHLQYGTNETHFSYYTGNSGPQKVFEAYVKDDTAQNDAYYDRKVFPGNTNRDTTVTNLLSNPFDARILWIVVETWEQKASMRVEILGCATNRGAIRLVDGASPRVGRVEVLHNGVWGTVCDRSWDINDAHVVCRQLGYGLALEAPGAATFGQGSGEIWLDNVECVGSEGGIADCVHSEWGTHNCDHGLDAGVVCAED